MKPLIFDYAISQQDTPWPNLKYDRDLGLNFVNNNKFVDLFSSSSALITKTNTRRETDDDLQSTDSINSIFYIATKTDTIKETDDELNSFQKSLYLLTKTEQRREEDE
ncbi:hypothetical protein [Leptospira licerasiae]|uniref:hypothetical protein n=1 Tax=Leptospira licerasiae TaxID=447106 RepID=UPI000248BF61|nr:hypothetical protein [Leptospira licerasiae]EIE01434.1 hypothetical protein LEP1GSC185_3923 [Leptospira licerasiae serovar Varillal str. VAR 010]